LARARGMAVDIPADHTGGSGKMRNGLTLRRPSSCRFDAPGPANRCEV
jgi:hypothetical protein